MEQQVLGGRYLLKDKVGNGGMATVYRAQDQVLDRTVAVKIMLPQYAADATFAARFKQEAQAAAGLQSPYIVGVYDWGKDGETYYIVMEYLRGTDLKSGIISHGALDPKKVAQIGSQICSALSVAHKHEIVHRDIKPQNIMVQPDGNIKVMDFGIARAKNSHLTQDNNVLGTAHYVSPEQTRGQELGPTSDIYSLGVVMYECATGRVPFDGDDAISVALKQVNEIPVPPSQINPGVDATLERIILRCMEKDAANRFQTADELRQALNAYLSGRPVDVPEPTTVIGAGAGLGATETRKLTDQTRTMARPVTPATSVTSKGARSSVSGNTGSYEEESKGGKGKIVAGVIAAIAVIGVVIAFAMGAFSGSKSVEVPDVRGRDQATATQMIKGAGLEVGNVDESYFDDVDEGLVAEQTPSPGQSREEGATVDLTISKGPKPAETTEVPVLTDLTVDEAEKALEAANLKGKATYENDDSDKDTVFWQGTNAGETVEIGTEIEYKVSLGPDTDAVPGVMGMTEADARNTLSNAGFTVKVDEYTTYNANYTYGEVIDQSPTGTQPKGSTITITVYHGQAPYDVNKVIGMTESQAKSKLQQEGYTIAGSRQQNDITGSIPAGAVLNVIDNGDGSVTLVISSGTGSSTSGGNGTSSNTDDEES